MNTDNIRSFSRKPATELATQYLGDIENLYQRAYFAQQVISNTLFKLRDLHTPGNLAWAKFRHAEVYVLGVHRAGGPGLPTYQNEYHARSEILEGGALAEGDFLVIGLKNSYGTLQRGFVPLHLLNNDPIAIAQWVRKSCREGDSKNRQFQIERLQQLRRIAATRQDGLYKTEEERQTRLDEIDAEIAGYRKLPKQPRVKKARIPVSA
jgi:hypothetical protein